MKALNLGSGPHGRAGWTNVDISISQDRRRDDGTVLVKHDLRRPLPFEDACFDVVYTSHFLEHIDTVEAVDLLKEARRVLRAGGLTRHCIPDARLAISAYCEGRQDFMRRVDEISEDFLPPAPIRTAIDYITQAAHGWDHKCLYDPAKAKVMLTAAGFVDVREDAFDPSLDEDVALRREFSFYVQGRAPGE